MKVLTVVSGIFRDSISKKPLLTILFIALFVRLVAVVFAKGYGMHDDHFLVVEAPQSWVDGTDYDNWLPQNQANPKAQGHSFFYIGIQYLLFLVMKWFGIIDPNVKMFIDRLLHALLSLLVVSSGYKIALKYGGQKNANQVGLFLALLWFMPFLSVRNLVEIVAIPFLMLGLWIIIDAEDRKSPKLWMFIGGIIIGLAFSARFQTILFIGGVGLALLLMKKWLDAIIMGIGALIAIVVIQGAVDVVLWGKPFAELSEYVLYNIIHKTEYGYNNYLMYPEVILGILIPPVSFFIVFGFFRTWKKYLLVFLPTFIFLAFHIYFPNKQERFILTIVPFIVITGIIGWNQFVETSKFWQNRQKFLIGCFIFFWIFNFLILLPISTAYSKKSRIEAMRHLYPLRSSIEAIVIDNNDRSESVFLPLFYLGKWVDVYQLQKDAVNTDSLKYAHLTRYEKKIQNLDVLKYLPDAKYPQYVLFCNNKDLEKRIDNIKKYYPDLTYEVTIKPSNLDKLMHKLNPVNLNQVIYIYRTQKQPFK